MTEPTSPFSERAWSECDSYEKNAWIEVLLNKDRYSNQVLDDALLAMLEVDCAVYTQGECLAELLESELWPVGYALIKVHGVDDNGVTRDAFVVCDAERNHEVVGLDAIQPPTPALAVCEAIVRNAWEKANE